MDLGPSTHDVAIERHSQSTDATGWTTDDDRVEVWTGRGTLFPAGATIRRRATGDDSGPYDPTSTSEWVIVVPVGATAAPGDVAVIEGQDYPIGRAIKRRGVVPSLDHLRLEVTRL